MDDGKIPSLTETGLKTTSGLEEENRYLKARVDELQSENFKVGHVISELRNELETVGLLQPSTGCDLHSFASQRQNSKSPPSDEENKLRYMIPLVDLLFQLWSSAPCLTCESMYHEKFQSLVFYVEWADNLEESISLVRELSHTSM